MNINRILRFFLCLGIAVLSCQITQGQVYGKLNFKSPIYADITTNSMYALAGDFRHRTRLEVVNLYSGNYNVQVLCKWKDMYRAKDMGTDRTFLIRQNDVVQLDNNLSQFNGRLPQSSYAQRNASFSAAVPYCIDQRFANPQQTNPTNTGFVNQPISRGVTFTNTNNPNTSRIHVVQPKENLYRIGLKYNIPHGELMSVNGLTSDKLQVGQRLRIERSSMPNATARFTNYPTGSTRGAEPLPTATQPTTVLTTVNTLQPRVSIRNTGFSSPEVVGSSTYTYIVKKGDNLSKIARSEYIGVNDILKFNPQIANRNKIKPGMRLTLPNY